MKLEPVQVVKLCYDHRWRDKNLVTIVAIAGAESGFDMNFDDGQRFGLFGIRPNDIHKEEDLKDPTYAAVAARNKYEVSHFAPWISYATGRYYNYIEQSVNGVRDFYLSLFESELRA